MKPVNPSISDRRMLVILAFISAFPPLSTDLYLPALPQMVTILSATPAKINLTLSLFFVFFGVGILIWGPLSDKYGRKPVLYCGLLIYILASLACAASGNYLQLVWARIFQAFGGGAATAVATAIVKDRYAGAQRARVLAVIMAMVITAPVVAPIIGSLLLHVASWRAIFLALAGFGVLSFALALPLAETLNHRYEGSALHAVGRLFVVLKNPAFARLLAIFSFIPMPLMAFIAGSSFVFIRGFGLSEQSFSLFFAANAVGAMLGPILYIRLSGRFHAHTLISAGFGVMAVSGILVAVFGHFSPVAFAAAMFPGTMACTGMRPPSANLMLEQQDRDTGSVSSLINFFGMLMGSVGMLLISLGTDHLIFFIGMMMAGVGSLGFLCWMAARRRVVLA